MAGVDQEQFTAALLDPGLKAPNGLCDPEGRPAGKRFNVYRNNVAVSLTEALMTAFPAVHREVGDEFFSAMAGVFLRAHPPRNALMMFYGEEMPAFLETFEPVAHLGYLPDLARLDLARRQSYHAADASPIKPTALQELSPETLMATKMKLAPAMRVLSSRWPVLSIWRYVMEDGAPKPQARAEAVLIARPEFDPTLSLLPQGADVFIDTLARGATLEDAVNRAGSNIENFDLASTLGLLLSGGVITGLYREEEE